MLIPLSRKVVSAGATRVAICVERSADEAGRAKQAVLIRTRILDGIEFDRFAPGHEDLTGRSIGGDHIRIRDDRQFPAQGGTSLRRSTTFRTISEDRGDEVTILNTDHKSCAAVVIDKRQGIGVAHRVEVGISGIGRNSIVARAWDRLSVCTARR